MRQLLLYLLVILCTNQVQGQYLLGLNEEGVKEKAKIFGGDSSITFRKTWYKDKAYALNWYDDQIECQVMVAFNPYTELSVVTTLVPIDTVVYRALTEWFEETYTKRGKEWWIVRIGGKVLKIESMEYQRRKSLVFREITPKELE